MPDDDKSLGGDKTFAGQPDPPSEPEQSLGDDRTFVGERDTPAESEKSLGDQSTFGDALSSISDNSGPANELGDEMPLVDLSERYEIQHVLGKGGMGEVLRALDTRLNRPVAIKRILGEMARSTKALSRFLTEAQSIAALNHFNIVQIYDYGRDAEGHFIIMELVEGESLQEKLKAGPLEFKEAIDLTCQLCDALAVAHEQGIIHRDIKPANILLTTRGEPKLTDFGLARQDSVDHGQTQAGAVLGTIDFMSPEQRRDATSVDARSDLWSLAASLYQMITGSSPKVIRLDQLPANLAPVIGTMLEENPNKRYTTAEQFKTELRKGMAAAAAPVAVDLAAGVCPACDTANDASRKFCRGCGDSLRVPCLACKADVPVWEKICGECGCKQDEQRELIREKLAATIEEGLTLAHEYEFEKALEQLNTVAKDPHAFNEDLRGQAAEQVTLVTAEWDQQNQLRDQLVQLANQHRQAHDYVAVVKELEKIPAPLRSGNPIAEQLSSAQAARDELSSLLQQMGSDIKNKRFDGLLEKTTRVLELNPKHDQVQKLREQLLERQQQAEDQAAELLGRAEQQYSQYEDEAVLKTVANWPPALQQPARVEQLHNLATDRLACVQELEAQISTTGLSLATETAENQRHVEKILLKKTTRFLQLCPGHPKIEKLHEQLLQRQQQAEDQAAELLGRAEQHYSYYEDEAVLKTVANWPPALQQPARVEQLQKMATDRLGRVQQLKKQIATTTIADRKLSLVEEYILLRPGDRQAGKIAEGLRQQIQQEKHRQRQAEWNRQQKQEEMKRQQTRKMIITGSGLAAVLLILMTGLWIRSGIKERAAAARADLVILLRMADIKAEADRLAADRLAADKAAAETTAAVKKQMTPAQLALGDPVVNSVGMLLVPIPAGEFPMGSPDGGSSERPQHLVKISKPFYLGVYEVTQQQYERVMGTRPWQGEPFVKEGADYAASYVSHDDAVEFCRRLSGQEGVEYRLPTEAEWEYACRAGTTTAYSFGDDESKLGQYAWYDKNAWDIGEKYAHRVGQKLPNRWGLYDMHGNVWEWCQDWYGPYGSEKVVSDPLGPAQGATRVLRGGSFNYRTSSVRSANRFNLPPGFRNDNLGFRAARTYHLSP